MRTNINDENIMNNVSYKKKKDIIFYYAGEKYKIMKLVVTK